MQTKENEIWPKTAYSGLSEITKSILGILDLHIGNEPGYHLFAIKDTMLPRQLGLTMALTVSEKRRDSTVVKHQMPQETQKGWSPPISGLPGKTFSPSTKNHRDRAPLQVEFSQPTPAAQLKTPISFCSQNQILPQLNDLKIAYSCFMVSHPIG